MERLLRSGVSETWVYTLQLTRSLDCLRRGIFYKASPQKLPTGCFGVWIWRVKAAESQAGEGGLGVGMEKWVRSPGVGLSPRRKGSRTLALLQHPQRKPKHLFQPPRKKLKAFDPARVKCPISVWS